MKRYNKYTFLLQIILSSILFSCGNPEKKEEIKNITFSEHIATIIYQHCTNCHRPGAVAPFSLITYKDVSKRAKLIRFVTETRFMPPWPADNTYTHFIDENVLSTEEIETIKKWVSNGSPIGDSTKIPAPPLFTDGSLLGKPDLVIRMREAIKIKGNNKDLFLTVKVPYEFSKDTFVRAIEYVPGNTKLVHHLNGHYIKYEWDKKKNVFEGFNALNSDEFTPMEIFNELSVTNDDGTFPVLTPSAVNYLPGVSYTLYPEGIGGFKFNRKGAILLNNIHYGPSRVDTTDNSYFNIFFGKKPERSTMEMQLGTLGISQIIPPLIVPANEEKTFYTQTKALMDMSILTINPHMHLLGKSYLAFAIKPDGDTIPLIRIKKWDFRWQYFYTFTKPIIIPQGSIIYAYGTFDNTKNNPFNPFNPPQQVTDKSGSMKTTDEMFQFIITYLPYKIGDENIDLRRK